MQGCYSVDATQLLLEYTQRSCLCTPDPLSRLFVSVQSDLHCFSVLQVWHSRLACLSCGVLSLISRMYASKLGNKPKRSSRDFRVFNER